MLDSGFAAAMLAGGWILSTPLLSARRALAGGALIGLGAAIKNPLAVLAFAIPIAAWQLDERVTPARQIRLLTIAVTAFALVGGWWYALETWRHGRAFLDFYVGYNVWERATVGIDGHRTALDLYAREWFREAPATFLAFVVALGLAARCDRAQLRAVAPLLAFIVVWLIAIHAAVSKRPIYLAPIYPAVAAASAPLLISMWNRIRTKRARRAVALGFGLTAAALLGTRYNAALDFSPDVAAAARDIAARSAPTDAIYALVTPLHLVSFYAQRDARRLDPATGPNGSGASWVVAPQPAAEALRERIRASEPARPLAIDCATPVACVVAIGALPQPP